MFMTKSLNGLRNYGKFSRKMLYKIFNGYFTSILHLPKHETVDLCTYMYEELNQKYGLKRVAERKFKHIIASIIVNQSFLRVRMQARLMRVGWKLGLEDFSNHATRFYIDISHWLDTSKSGILREYNEFGDIQLIPTMRAIECIKERLSPFCFP